jgi:hypothetical protein
MGVHPPNHQSPSRFNNASVLQEEHRSRLAVVDIHDHPAVAGSLLVVVDSLLAAVLVHRTVRLEAGRRTVLGLLEEHHIGLDRLEEEHRHTGQHQDALEFRLCCHKNDRWHPGVVSQAESSLVIRIFKKLMNSYPEFRSKVNTLLTHLIRFVFVI